MKKFLSTTSFGVLNHEHIASHRGFHMHRVNHRCKSDNTHHHADPVVGMWCLKKRVDPQKNVAQKGLTQKNCVISTNIKLNASNVK